MRKILNICFCGLLIMGLNSCKNRKSASESAANISKTNFTKVLSEKALDWEFIDISANVDYKTDPFIPKLNCYLRMQKEEIIWVSVRSVIGELARIKIDKDSIHALMRLPNKEYHVLPIQAITKYLPGVQGINEVQRILLNEAPFPVKEYEWVEGEGLDSFALFMKNELLKNYLFGERKIGRIVDCHVSNLEETYFASILYTNPQEVEKKTLPYNMEIHGKADSDSVHILINYNSVKIKDELIFPFVVGDSYERK